MTLPGELNQGAGHATLGHEKNAPSESVPLVPCDPVIEADAGFSLEVYPIPALVLPRDVA